MCSKMKTSIVTSSVRAIFHFWYCFLDKKILFSLNMLHFRYVFEDKNIGVHYEKIIVHLHIFIFDIFVLVLIFLFHLSMFHFWYLFEDVKIDFHFLDICSKMKNSIFTFTFWMCSKMKTSIFISAFISDICSKMKILMNSQGPVLLFKI